MYSVIQPDSLQAAKTSILAELREFAPLVRAVCLLRCAVKLTVQPQAPIILIGNKTDMRADEDVCERLKKRQMAPLSLQVRACPVGSLNC